MDRYLKEIDNDINAAYEMCIKAGYSHEEAQKFAKPILEPVVRERRKRQLVLFLKSLTKVVVIFAAILSLLYYIASNDNSVNEKIATVFRLGNRAFLMQALFFWDWTPLYHSPCLINNPYFGGSALIKADCEECENFRQINHVTKLSPEKFTHNYFARYRPVIVEDATDKWPLMKETFNIEKVLEWYLEDDNVEEVCKFNSSMTRNSSREVLTEIVSGNATEFAVYWVNCNKNAVRYLRKYYSRPYFSSDAVEFTGNTWVVLSSKFKTKGYEHEKLEDVDMALFLVQARGYSNIRLTPKKPFLIPAKMWSLDYSFTDEVDNFLLGLEALA
ncbi:hypothetical protein GQR58_002853 [Nymphon striatum]|nr:hypothetical protein GQR58_002853 [Nymphon striatum]